ncbi:MAG: NADH-quinone oxidoreductase subunit N [Kofleriaceae bacterium]|nr:NADH-quinone oxidoreductase subunit N [Kofleriaceae bacterium]
MKFNTQDLAYLTPYLILVVTGMVLVLAEAFYQGKDRTALSSLAVAGSLAAFVASIVLYKEIGTSARPLFTDMLVADRSAYVLSALFSASTALTALMTAPHQKAFDWQNGEFYGVLLMSASGMVMLAHAVNLVSVFLGIETMSIGVYVMVGLRRRSRRGNEAALKYFLMGAFATGFMLYGMALLYGASGTLSLIKMQPALLASSNSGLAVVGAFLLVVAFGFKVAAVPFHMWAPDAYEGAPTPVTAFMAAAVKAAAVAAMIRVFSIGLGGDVIPYGALGWASPLIVVAAITITFGNIAAVRQDNVKRMLAYSSISHGGVLLVGLCAMGLGSSSAEGSMTYYLIAYTVTTMGAFAVMTFVGNKNDERLGVDQWAGLGASHPGAALAMTVCLLSLGGMPPTGGFFAKFSIFKSAMEVYDGQLSWIVVLGVLNSAISIFYYLKIVTSMYFKDAATPFAPTRSPGLIFVLVICPLIILEMGIMPGFWMRIIGQ